APYSGRQLVAGQFVAVFGPADAHLAALDSLLGDPGSAADLFAPPLAQATGLGALLPPPPPPTPAAAHPGSAPSARPRRGEARPAEARRLATSTGQCRLLRILDCLDQESRAGSAGAGTDPGGPDAAGLTPREVAVLRLLADGSSNREIATRLKITENTAANH